jgi:hypothetical protein
MTQIICPKTQPNKNNDDEEFLMYKIAKRMITRNFIQNPKTMMAKNLSKNQPKINKKKQKNIKYGYT